ncbi:hypothetical protein K504DRAFT_451516 [Pleomassaria siparia CBS 279.74]|uniref:Uncharacterized protein n=1 Tax=Pleomassaria siparia CBS 279.74 TaxID=1314801 RepID=A0A6G1JST1_9PLEO|nr:hypothetical protein K504DRAFT_451516 [Pleomassaria siparia CBS 279.74]
METMHTETSQTGVSGRPPHIEPRYLTSPYPPHIIRLELTSPRNNTLPLFETIGIPPKDDEDEDDDDEEGGIGNDNAKQSFSTTDFANVQPSSQQQVQQTAFERSLRPLLLPKVANYGVLLDSLDSRDSPWAVESCFAQSHNDTKTGSRQHINHAPNHHPPWPNPWIQARDYRHRIHEPPYHTPTTDPTMAEVEHSSEHWIAQLTHAIRNLSDIKDPATSHAARLFQPGTYSTRLIDSTARHIFTALLDRCHAGFRAPAHFNRALGRPGGGGGGRRCEPDRTASCHDRIGNVVAALMWNKRVCKDVLYEDWKVMLLVNHPLAYDREKDSQKGSNDQRRARLVGDRERLARMEGEVRRLRLRRRRRGIISLQQFSSIMGNAAAGGNGGGSDGGGHMDEPPSPESSGLIIINNESVGFERVAHDDDDDDEQDEMEMETSHHAAKHVRVMYDDVA